MVPAVGAARLLEKRFGGNIKWPHFTEAVIWRHVSQVSLRIVFVLSDGREAVERLL